MSIEWVWPWAFVLLPLPVLVRWLFPPVTDTQAALTVPDVGLFKVDATEQHLLREPSRNLWIIALTLAWICLVVAVARPQITGEAVQLPTSGRDLMLAVDISGSMGTEDLELGNRFVDRLSVVKRVVSAFIDERSGDRIGLILFGTSAYLQTPLTFDLQSVKRLLNEAPVGIAGGKTAIGDAIGLAVKRLRQRPAGDRVLILLTDGANNVGEVEPNKAAQLAAAEDIRIYTIGVGADELRMPSIFGGFGSRIVNPSADLDEKTLTNIAETTSGRYFRAQDTQTLAQIYAIIDELEPVEQDPETYRPITALYYLPLAMGWSLVCLLLVMQLLRNRRAHA